VFFGEEGFLVYLFSISGCQNGYDVSDIHANGIVPCSSCWLCITRILCGGLCTRVSVPQNECSGNTVTLPCDFCSEQLGWVCKTQKDCICGGNNILKVFEKHYRNREGV